MANNSYTHKLFITDWLNDGTTTRDTAATKDIWDVLSGIFNKYFYFQSNYPE